ncbi:MAG TPA: peptide chain release factor-like protein [bacterium]|jgi:protein subunit release factor A
MLVIDQRTRKDIHFETFTPGGPGGQHANRTSSAVRAVHIPSGLSAIAREHRSQARNRELALERLIAKLKARQRRRKPRVPTKVPSHAQEKRLQGKVRRSQTKALRKKVPQQ